MTATVIPTSTLRPTASPTPNPTPARKAEPLTEPASYRAPGLLTRRLMNPLVAWATRRGLSIWGSRVLAVKGRTTGVVRETPVNLLHLDGDDYLVAPRGVTQWVRNLRAAGEGELRVGRHRQAFAATEVDDADKPEVLRAYLARWKAEVGVFFDGVGPDSPAEELARIAPDHPVFRLRDRASDRPAA